MRHNRPLLDHAAELASYLSLAREGLAKLSPSVNADACAEVEHHIERSLEVLATLVYEVRQLAATVVTMTGAASVPQRPL